MLWEPECTHHWCRAYLTLSDPLPDFTMYTEESGTLNVTDQVTRSCRTSPRNPFDIIRDTIQEVESITAAPSCCSLPGHARPHRYSVTFIFFPINLELFFCLMVCIGCFDRRDGSHPRTDTDRSVHPHRPPPSGARGWTNAGRMGPQWFNVGRGHNVSTALCVVRKTTWKTDCENSSLCIMEWMIINFCCQPHGGLLTFLCNFFIRSA